MNFRRNLLHNQKGIGTVFGMVFFILIVMIVFASFLIILNQNTGLEQTIMQSKQLDIDRSREELTITPPSTTSLFTNIQATALTVNYVLNNTGTLPVEVVRLWVLDLNNSMVSSLPLQDPALQQGQSTVYAKTVALSVTNPSSDQFIMWVTTARGNKFSVESSGSTTAADINKALSEAFGDFLPDYNSVQWATVTTTDGVSTPGVWQSGWVVPTNPTNQKFAFKLNVTYYGMNSIRIDNDTNLWFNNLQQGSVVFENNQVAYINGQYIGVYPTLYITYYDSMANTLNLYNGHELNVSPSNNPNPITLYFSTTLNWSASDYGSWNNWPITPSGSPAPTGYPIGCISPNAQLSLVLYGMSPSNYAQTFSLFAVQSRSISIQLNPISGVVGTSVTVTGTGFNANSGITMTFDSTQVTIPTTTTSASGAFSTTFTVPQAVAGSHTVTATDSTTSHNAATAVFTVTPSLSSPSPSQGPQGTSVGITGTGFAASTPIHITLGGVDQPTSPNTVTTDTKGSFSASFTVTTIATGSQTIVTTDTNGNSASKSFTVTVPSISVSPQSVSVGTTITVSGSNFLPSTVVGIYYDNALATSTVSTSGGALTAGVTFTIPPSTYGSHTIRATDSYSNTATGTVNVSPVTAVNPTSGVIGTLVAITGSGFASSSAVTISFASTAIVTNPAPVITDNVGSFSASFNVPIGSTTGSIAGAKVVTATDASSHLASTTFTITPIILLNSTSGSTGTAVNATGTGFGPSKIITIKYDGTTQTTTPATVTTTAYGTFSCTFSIPASSNGGHSVSATDASANTASASFTVSPTINLTPTTSTFGSTVTVSGTGFGASKAITGTFDGTPLTLGGSTTTGSTGSFTATFTVPAAAKGSHTVGIIDASGNTASATLAVTAGIFLNPSSGAAGSTVTISGGGFAASLPISFTYNGIALVTTPGTVTTNTAGSFTATFTVPSSATASNTVQASDGTNTATATFTQTVSITITSNPIGTGLVNVDGVSTTTPVTFTWNVGSTHSLQANSPVAAGTDTQYVYTGWSDSGTQTHTYTTPSSPQTVTATFKTQYKLTMNTNFGSTTPATANWYDSGATITIQATPPTPGSSERYVWNGWTGSGLGSYTGTNNPATNAVTMNAPITETAVFTHQFQVTFAVSGSGTTNPTGTNIWEDAGSLAISASANTYNHFTSWSATNGVAITSPSSASTTANINAACTLTASFAANAPVTVIIRPNAVGTTTQLTASSGNNYLCTDEISSDGDTSYVSTTNSGFDTYALSNSGLSAGSISQVTVHVMARYTGGSGTAREYIRIGATNYNNPSTHTLTTSYVDYSYSWATNPNSGSAWTWSNVDSLEAGVGLTQSGGFSTDTARCTQVWVEITYVPP
jgi:hypothetical protein